MKIALASDLHHEFYAIPPALEYVEAAVLVLAGDIETVKSHSNHWWDRVSEQYPLIIYIHGNHEYYHSYYAERPTFYFPKNVMHIPRMQEFKIDNYKVLAGTMWTNLSYGKQANLAQLHMNDYKLTRYSHEDIWFTPEHTTREHISFRTMLYENTPDVVISHHLPSYGSIHKDYQDDRLNCAFATELNIEGVKLWMHGHTHRSCDYIKQGCRVVCNPKGYPRENVRVYTPKVIEI